MRLFQLSRLATAAPALLLLTIFSLPFNSYGQYRSSQFNRNDHAKQKRARTSVDSLAINPDLALALHFDEGSGQIAVDSSGNNNNGLLGSTLQIDGTDPTWISPGAFGSSAALHFDASR